MKHLIPHLLALSLTLFVQTRIPQQQISKICFNRGEFIFVKDMTTGGEKRLVKGSYPSLSPNGQLLAFSVDSAGGSANDLSRQIKLFDLQTGKLTSFGSLRNFLCYGALWSPDGSKIAFSILRDKDWEVAVMDAASHEWRVLTNKLSKSFGVSLNSWTADSKSILCQDLANIYQVGMNGELRRTIAVSDAVDDVSYISSSTTFSLSSDGRYLLFDTDQLPDQSRPAMLWIYEVQTRKRRRLRTGRLSAFNPRWSPTEDQIIFTGVSQVRGGKRVPNIYRMGIDGGDIKMLVANGDQASVAYSP